MAPCLILTGFMGTGKSSIAPILARRLAWTYIDSDEVLVARAGKSIAAIFESEGEAQFRKLEREVIADIAQSSAAMPAIRQSAAGGHRDWRRRADGRSQLSRVESMRA